MIVLTAYLGLAFSLYAQPSQAPTPSQSISEPEVRKHLLSHDDIVYPAIAQAARVEGDVAISIVIDSSGRVATEKVLSGPAMLQGAALSAVDKWRFTPFEIDGMAAQVTTTIVIPFHLIHDVNGPDAEQEAAAQAWFPLSDKCRKSNRARDTEAALADCKQALDMSYKAGDLTSSDQLARLDSLQAYGHALYSARRFAEALEEENKAVDEAKAHLKDNQQEYANPFAWRATVEAALGQAAAANDDLKIAEDTQRRAIQDLPEMKQIYSRYLASFLRQHAALLQTMGKNQEASKLQDEANSLMAQGSSKL